MTDTADISTEASGRPSRPNLLPIAVLLIGAAPDVGPYALPGNNYHVYDYNLFWGNVREDAQKTAALVLDAVHNYRLEMARNRVVSNITASMSTASPRANRFSSTRARTTGA